MKTLLLALFALLFAACSSSSSPPALGDGWENTGTLQQPLLRRTFEVTPANATYDFNNATQLNQDGWIGPFLVGLSGWVVTDDVAAGSLVFDITYTDPTSTTRTVDFGGASPVLTLSDPASFFATQATWMLRQSGSSAWDLNVGLFGSAGTSTVHYEIMVAPTEQAEWSFFSDQP